MNYDVVVMFDENAIALKKRITELEAERDKAQANYQFMVNRACNEKLDGYRELGAKCASLEEERDACNARLRVTAQILISKVGADGPVNANEVAVKAVRMIEMLEAEVERLKAHTWQQERAAVAYWIRKLVRFPGAYPGTYAKRIERGEHWSEGETP